MVTPTPASAMGVSTGRGGNDDLRSSGDPDGTLYSGNGGDDILRGGKTNDILVGGAGNDVMSGGLGADQFRFFGNVFNDGDLDKIYDLTFTQGDSLVFGSWQAGLFEDKAGVNAFAGGGSAIVSSYEGIAHLIRDSDGAITYSQKGATTVLILNIENGAGDVQTIHITGAFQQVQAFLDNPTF